jgi:putative ABC transport system permease protein
MTRRRWLLHLVVRGLAYRRGRTLLLLLVLTMASSLVTALGIVSGAMGTRVAEELKKYGANLVIIPQAARVDIGSGGLNFGTIAEPAYLDQREVLQTLDQGGAAGVSRSLHLRCSVLRGGTPLAAEGVHFEEIRRSSPWWQLKGSWPGTGEAMIGRDLAAAQNLKPGDMLALNGPGGELRLRITGIVSTGGEEEQLVFLDLSLLQQLQGLTGQISQVRLLVTAGGERLATIAARIQERMRGVRVMEIRQVARTSEGLLHKVQLLMLLTTVVVVVASAGSIAGTMSTTVLERGKEIGLMKAMGGTRREVLLIFSGEALVLGLSGGVGGFIAGNGVAALVLKTVFAAGTGLSGLFLPVAVAASLFLALLGSLGPLLSVFRLDPSQSLRGD